MKKLIYLLPMLAVMFAACDGEKVGTGDSGKGNPSEPGVTTVSVTDIQKYSATFNGKVVLPEQMATDFELGFEISDGESFPKESTQRFKVENYNPDKTYSYTIDDLRPSGTYYVRAYMINQMCLYTGTGKKFQTLEWTPDYVDLGLSVKWATCNVGATAPEVYGDYYAWGATEPLYEAGYAQEDPQNHWKTGKSDGYCWNNTPYQMANTTDESITQWTKYLGSTVSTIKDPSATDANTIKIILDLTDDAARANWGGNWRMPTREEWSELRNSSNCTWTWTTMNGVNGYKVQSKKVGYTDRWIFLPAAGCRYDMTLYGTDDRGSYWSSSLSPYYPCRAEPIYFGSNFVDNKYSSRYDGSSVRPVCSDDPNCGITGVTLNKTVTSIYVDANETLTATVSKNAGAVNNQVEWSSSNTAVATVDYTGKVTAVKEGTATITAKTVFGGFTATCTVTVETFTVGYVDLGLSVKWANCNVGANAIEEYGNYYAWGATEPLYEAGYAQAHWKTGKSDGYVWNNTPYQTANTTDYESTKWTKYLGSTTSEYKDASATDADALKTVLDLTDDAARANWGGSWRMPTIDEWAELRNSSNCTWTWTTINGINGYKVQSLKTGYTDKWIFLPAAGYRYYTYLLDVGSGGYYWSSSLNTFIPGNARSFYFYSSNRYTSYYDRNYGQSVRPVCQ